MSRLGDNYSSDAPHLLRTPSSNAVTDVGRHDRRLLLIGTSVLSRQMRLLREQHAPGASSGEERIVHAEGEECGVVTRGTVELTVDGAMSVLNAGDGYYVPTTLPHKLRNIGADEAEIISANTPAKLWLVSVRTVVSCE